MSVSKKVLTWLAFNLCVQLVPVGFVLIKTGGNGQFWEFFSCSLLLGISLGMLVATMSDVRTEGCRVDGLHWALMLTVAAVNGILLIAAVHVEFLLRKSADDTVLYCASGISAATVVVSAMIKGRIWKQGP